MKDKQISTSTKISSNVMVIQLFKGDFQFYLITLRISFVLWQVWHTMTEVRFELVTTTTKLQRNTFVIIFLLLQLGNISLPWICRLCLLSINHALYVKSLVLTYSSDNVYFYYCNDIIYMAIYFLNKCRTIITILRSTVGLGVSIHLSVIECI